MIDRRSPLDEVHNIQLDSDPAPVSAVQSENPVTRLGHKGYAEAMAEYNDRVPRVRSTFNKHVLELIVSEFRGHMELGRAHIAKHMNLEDAAKDSANVVRVFQTFSSAAQTLIADTLSRKIKEETAKLNLALARIQAGRILTLEDELKEKRDKPKLPVVKLTQDEQDNLLIRVSPSDITLTGGSVTTFLDHRLLGDRESKALLRDHFVPTGKPIPFEESDVKDEYLPGKIAVLPQATHVFAEDPSWLKTSEVGIHTPEQFMDFEQEALLMKWICDPKLYEKYEKMAAKREGILWRGRSRTGQVRVPHVCTNHAKVKNSSSFPLTSNQVAAYVIKPIDLDHLEAQCKTPEAKPEARPGLVPA